MGFGTAVICQYSYYSGNSWFLQLKKLIVLYQHPCVLKGHMVVFLLFVSLLVNRMVLIGWILGNTSLQKWWLSTGKGSPGRWLSHHPWMCLKTIWMWCSGT